MHQSDPQLVAACCRGDQAAWNDLIERYGRLVYSIPRQHGLNEADADDVFAAVWASAFRHLSKLRDKTRLSSWLITTAHREAWRVARARSPAVTPGSILAQQLQDPSDPSPELAETWEHRQLLWEALEALGGRCKDLLTALFLEPGEPSYEAIAQRLDIALGSIGPTRARCFKKLHKILVNMGFDPGRQREASAAGADV